MNLNILDDNIDETNGKLYFENTNNIQVLVIDFGTIDNLEWKSENYLNNLLDLDLFKFIETNSEDLIRLIPEELQIDKYVGKNIRITTDKICDDKQYIYEMMFVDVDDGPKINDAATLINTNNIKIFSKAIIFKTYLPENNDSMLLNTITKNDIINLMETRISTNIVLYESSSLSLNKKKISEEKQTFTLNENDFREMKISGDLNKFAEEFFEGEGFIKVDFEFLLYDMSIWYTSDCGSKDVFGKLINNPVESCIIFIKLSNELRGSISLEEVIKIINLSHKLTSFKVPEEYTKIKKDNYNRNIIDNKYRLLSKLYSKYN